MPAAAYKSSAGFTGVNTAPSGTIGAAVAGDTKILVVFGGPANSGITLSDVPAGYTQRQAWAYWAAGENYVAVFSKAVTVTEGSSSVGFTLSTSIPWGLSCFVVTGDWDAISNNADSYTGYSVNATAPSVTTTTTNTVVVNAVACGDWRQFAPPAGVTEVFDLRDASLSVSIAAGYLSVAAAGATPTYGWTFRAGDDPNTLNAAVGRSVSFAIKASASDTALEADSTFPAGAYTYETTAITASPSAIGVSTGSAPQVGTLTDQLGFPVAGALWSSSVSSVATVTSPSDSSGQVTVSFGAVGSTVLTATYDDSMSSPTTASVSVTVASPAIAPTITTVTLPDGTLGSLYVQTLATTGTEPVMVVVTSGALPAGLTLVGKTISGTPTVAGASSFTLTPSGPGGLGTPRAMTLTVVAPVVAPAVTTTSLGSGIVGVAYSQALTTTGTEPVAVAVTSGTLPAGLTLAGKTISGTPTTAGTSAFSVTPTGPGGTGSSRALSISVVSQDVAPAFITTSVASGVVGAPYSQVVAASGTGTITRSIVSGSLPPGLTLDGATGAITGTPTAVGAYAFRVQASNGVGSPAFVDLTINIYAVSQLTTETSGSTTFSPTITEILEEAYERAGSEMRSGYNYRTARRSLNLLTIEWASRGINLWTIEQGSIPLQAGVGTYFIPVDTIDLVEHTIRQNPGSSATQTDITISRIALPTYAAIPNKLTTGRPIQIYIDRQAGVQTPTGVSTPTVTVWPIPPDNSYTLVYWRLRRIQDAGTGVNIPDIPFRFLPCLVAGLAFYIAMKIPEGQERLGMLQVEYERQWQLASEEDRDKAPVRFVPRTSFFR